ncbi:MAG: lipopolysaccharide biosynthesis protein [Clostridiales bacterium]|nr:lipopolysaccharide biosynthesis protein [Clostridiales bacterium]
MSRGSQVIKTTAIYFIGNFASKLLAFFLLPLYTAYLTSEDFGNVDLLISTLPLIAPIFTLQVTEAVFRFLCTDENLEDRKKSISNSFMIFSIGILIFTILYIPFFIKFNLTYPLLFFIYFIVTYMGIFFQQILRGLQRTVEYALTGVISTAIHATMNILLIIKFGMGGESLLISSIGGSLVIAIFISIRIKIWEFIDLTKISKLEIKKQLKYGVPLIPNQISWWIIGLLGKYILLYFHGSSDNGILAVASKFPGLLTTINSIFFLAWTENVIREFESEDRDEYYSKGFQLFSKFTFCSAACLLPVIKIYNMTTITGEFVDAWKYVPVLIIGTSFNSLAAFLGTVYTASMKTRDAFTTTVIAAVSNFILSLLMIPIFSIWGVALANMLSFIVLFFVRIKSVNTIIKFKFRFIQMIPSILLLIVSIIGYYTLNIYNQIILFLILAIGALIINKRIVIEIVNFIKNLKNKSCIQK